MSPKRVRRHIRQQRKDRRRAIREQERAAKLKAKQDAGKARAALKEEQLQERRRAAEEKRAQQQEAQQEKAEQKKTQQEKTQQSRSPRRKTLQDKNPQDKTPQEKTPPQADPSVKNPAERKADAGPALKEDGAVLHGTQDPAAPRRGAKHAGTAASAAPQTAESGSSEAGPRRSHGHRVAAVVVTAGILAAGGGSFAYDLLDSSAPLGRIGAAEIPAPGTGVHRVCPPMPGQAASLSSDGLLDYAERDDSASSTFKTLLLDADGAGTFPDASTATLTEDGLEEGSEVAEAPAPQDRTQNAPGAEAPLGEREALTGATSDLVDPALLEVSAAPDDASSVAGALYDYYADSGPVAGLAVSSCSAPQRSQWFFGPELGGGSTSLLTLANPYDRDATVDVTSYDGDGARPGTGARSLVVPAQSTRSLNVAAIAGGEQELGLSVEASGAPVAAQLQSSRATGPEGQGVEFLPGVTESAGEHHIPSVPVPEEEGSPAELWLHAPGEEQVTVELQVFGTEGQVTLENPSVFTVEGGELDSVRLEGLESGVYDVVVRAEEPLHAAARTEGDGQGSAADFSWSGPAPALGSGSGTLLPDPGESSLRLAGGQQGGTVTYRLVDGDGGFSEPQELEVPAEGAVTLSTEDLEGVMEDAVAVIFEEAEGQLHAALLTEDETGRFSVTAVEELVDRSGTVPVRLRD